MLICFPAGNSAFQFNVMQVPTSTEERIEYETSADAYLRPSTSTSHGASDTALNFTSESSTSTSKE